MSSPPPQDGSGRKSMKVLVLAVAVVIIIALVVPVFPSSRVVVELRTSSTVKEVLELSYGWSTSTYYTYSTALNTYTRTYARSSGLVIEPGRCLYWDINFMAGSDIVVYWRTDESADVYVYDDIEGQKWLSGQDATPLYSRSGNEGRIYMHVPSSGLYYVAVCNPHTGIIGIGAKNVGLLEFEVEGTEFTHITITETRTTVVPVTYTSTKWVTEPVTYTTTTTKTVYESILQKLLSGG